MYYTAVVNYNGDVFAALYLGPDKEWTISKKTATFVTSSSRGFRHKIYVHQKKEENFRVGRYLREDDVIDLKKAVINSLKKKYKNFEVHIVRSTASCCPYYKVGEKGLYGKNDIEWR